MKNQIRALKKFREDMYTTFPKRRAAIMNLLDALLSYGHRCKSIVQLSKARCYERQYSSITDAIADGLPHVDWREIKKLIYRAIKKPKEVNRFIIDCTSNPRPYAQKLGDRIITHTPNPAPGNKPICVGHQYSLLGLLPNDTLAVKKHWLIPLSIERVGSQAKGNEHGMKQIINCIEELDLSDQISISIGDSLYGTEKCRIVASQQKNLIHIFRINSKRNLFRSPETHSGRGKGRKKEFGDKMTLNDQETHSKPDEKAKTTWLSRKNRRYEVEIECWRNMLLRGSRKFRSSKFPINLVKICVFDQQGKMIFKRPLWLGIFGEHRDKISLIDCYKNYSNRYDIEHLFRFGKQKLLLDAYQTPDLNHEEHWWQLCLLAYVQLYLGRELAPLLPEAWERYLPEFKSSDTKAKNIASPSQTQRGFNKILEKIGTPASSCIARGKPCGRMPGKVLTERKSKPVIFKQSKSSSQSNKTIFSGFEKEKNKSNPEKINELLEVVRSNLRSLDLSAREFAEKLLDSG